MKNNRITINFSDLEIVEIKKIMHEMAFESIGLWIQYIVKKQIEERRKRIGTYGNKSENAEPKLTKLEKSLQNKKYILTGDLTEVNQYLRSLDTEAFPSTDRIADPTNAGCNEVLHYEVVDSPIAGVGRILQIQVYKLDDPERKITRIYSEYDVNELIKHLMTNKLI